MGIITTISAIFSSFPQYLMNPKKKWRKFEEIEDVVLDKDGWKREESKDSY